MSGQKLPLKMSVDYISFSAHTDYQQTSEFIRALKPPHVVSGGVLRRGRQVAGQVSCCYCGFQILVHGEQNEMARLKAALIREYEDNDEVHIEVHNPRNTEAVTLNFRGEKLAKVRLQLSLVQAESVTVGLCQRDTASPGLMAFSPVVNKSFRLLIMIIITNISSAW